MEGKIMRLTTMIVLCLMPALSSATEVFTCVDADGVRLFSETPLQQCQSDTELVLLDDVAPTPSDDRYSVINQLKRLQERNAAEKRAQLEKQLLEAQIRESRRNASAPPQQAQVPVPPVQSQPLYFPYPAQLFPRTRQSNRLHSRSQRLPRDRRSHSNRQQRRSQPPQADFSRHPWHQAHPARY